MARFKGLFTEEAFSTSWIPFTELPLLEQLDVVFGKEAGNPFLIVLPSQSLHTVNECQQLFLGLLILYVLGHLCLCQPENVLNEEHGVIAIETVQAMVVNSGGVEELQILVHLLPANCPFHIQVSKRQ